MAVLVLSKLFDRLATGGVWISEQLATVNERTPTTNRFRMIPNHTLLII
jgi:hypothetical protein